MLHPLPKHLFKACLVLWACTAFAVHLHAVEYDFPQFIIEIPETWSVKTSNSTVTLTANDKSAAVTITFVPTNGITQEAMAKGLSQQLKGGTPKRDEGWYTFSFVSDGYENTVWLDQFEDNFILYCIVGDNPLLASILGSVQYK